MITALKRPLATLLATLPSFLHAESLDRLREDFLQLRFGMFIHFNMGTFHEKEWGPREIFSVNSEEARSPGSGFERWLVLLVGLVVGC